MITIPIQVSGDEWNNKEQVKEILAGLPNKEKVVFNLLSEGPSLARIGLISLAENYDLDFYIESWANNIENVPFKKTTHSNRSHFYPMSNHYWIDTIDNFVPTDYRFGLFLGRSTLSRNRILYDSSTRWPGKFLLSKMRNKYQLNSWVTNPMSLENQSEWFENVEVVQHWMSNCPVNSIDNYVIQDQYITPELSSAELALSLLKFYKKFNVELVCETYTLGETFFPTEKTVRPIVGNRPFIVYGPKNFLHNLKQQEGFQTFNSIWDESYDQLEGRARWNAMSELVDHLLSLTDQEWTQVVEQASVITQHNRTILKNIINDRKKL